jgi:hypothetical protein
VAAVLSFLDPKFQTVSLARLCLLRVNAAFSSLAEYRSLLLVAAIPTLSDSLLLSGFSKRAALRKFSTSLKMARAPDTLGQGGHSGNSQLLN